MMNSSFESIPDDKRTRIINAAFKIFAEYGYKKASTIEIVKEAGISKGLLFHYFENKKGLYTYLYEYGTTIFSEDLMSHLDLTHSSIIERLHQVIRVKMKLINEYPDVIRFIQSAYFEKDENVRDIIKKLHSQGMQDAFKRIYAGIDYSYFKPKIDIERAIKTMNYTLEKWSDDYMRQLKALGTDQIDVRYVEEELSAFIELFRICFYS